MLRHSMAQRKQIHPGPTGQRRSSAWRIGRFILVGCLAAAVHWGLVVLLVRQWGWLATVANLPAWLCAFAVSFAGHQRWTFNDSRVAGGHSARRLFVISAAGFAVNESAYILLLRWTGLRFDLVLAGLLVAVAAVTYVAARRWAFAGKADGH